MTLIPGYETLGQLIEIAKDRSDNVNNPYISPNEWTRYANMAYTNYYDLLIEKYAENYPNSTPYLFTTDGTNQQYQLPPDFYKKIGLDLQYAGGPNGWLTIHEAAFIDRNRYAYPFNVLPAGYTNIRCRLVGDTIMLIPVPQSGFLFRLWYAPRPKPLAISGKLMLNQLTAGDTLTINPNYAPAIQNPSGAVVASLGNPITFTAGTSFTIVSGDMPTTAVNLATAINASALNTTYGLVAQAQLGTPFVELILPWSGTTVQWSTSNLSHFQLRMPPIWGNLFDAISGWHKLITIDMALSALSKEESDCSQLNLERQEEVARIESAAAIRSPDEPDHVVNVSNRGGGFGSYNYAGGNGGWGDGY